jgi:hypothetical protein
MDEEMLSISEIDQIVGIVRSTKGARLNMVPFLVRIEDAMTCTINDLIVPTLILTHNINSTHTPVRILIQISEETAIAWAANPQLSGQGTLALTAISIFRERTVCHDRWPWPKLAA